MSIVLVILGLAIVLVAALDMVETTLILSGGGGPLTQRVINALWRYALDRHQRRPSRFFLARFVWVLLLCMILLWSVMLLFGWTLVFAAGDTAVVDTNTNEAADFWSRLYYAGYSLITLGTGDFRPQGAVWQFTTIVAAASGFFIITLTITYLSPLVTAATQKRQLASMILGIGATPHDVLVQAWKDHDFNVLAPFLVSLVPMLYQHSQNHLSYPALHYFLSQKRRSADAISIAVLDESLTLLEYALPPERRPKVFPLKVVRHAVDDYLDKLKDVTIEPTEEAPPPPSLEPLRQAGIPVVDNAAFRASLSEVSQRRRLLLALVRSNGWEWQHVYDADLETH